MPGLWFSASPSRSRPSIGSCRWSRNFTRLSSGRSSSPGRSLSAQAVVLLVLAWLAPRPPVANILSPDVVNDLGNLLFTFLILWAYMVWFQFMLIWIANLRYEVIWYLPRSEGGWQWVAWALLAIFHFVGAVLLAAPARREATLARAGERGRAATGHATGLQLLPRHAGLSRNHDDATTGWTS